MTEKDRQKKPEYKEHPVDASEIGYAGKCKSVSECCCESVSGNDCNCGGECGCGGESDCGSECTPGERGKQAKLKLVETLCNEDKQYHERLAAYETLSEDGEEVADEMLQRLYNTEGDTQQMLIEILANFKGRRDIYMWLVTFLYRGEDVALSARLLGSYGDEAAIEVLKSFADENELNYNEFMEVRNAVEALGGDIEEKTDYSDDPFYQYLKGQAGTHEEEWEAEAGFPFAESGNGDDDADAGDDEK